MPNHNQPNQPNQPNNPDPHHYRNNITMPKLPPDEQQRILDLYNHLVSSLQSYAGSESVEDSTTRLCLSKLSLVDPGWMEIYLLVNVNACMQECSKLEIPPPLGLAASFLSLGVVLGRRMEQDTQLKSMFGGIGNDSAGSNEVSPLARARPHTGAPARESSTTSNTSNDAPYDMDQGKSAVREYLRSIASITKKDCPTKGRPVKLVPCPYCGGEFGTVQLRQHKKECEGRP